MKKINSFVLCALSLCAAFMLNGCGQKSEDDSQTWRFVSSLDTLETDKNGMFIEGNSRRLEFLDFSTGDIVPMCDDPTCTHQESEDCSAYGKLNHTFLYRSHLYWFEETDFYQTEDGYQTDLLLYRSNLNGDKEKQLFQLEGYGNLSAGRYVLYGNMLYFFAYTENCDTDYQENAPTYRLMAYNLKKNKLEDYGEIVSGYSSGCECAGIWQNQLYFHTSYSTDNRPYMERLEEFMEQNEIENFDDASDAFNQKFIEEIAGNDWIFDLTAETITESEDYPELLTNNCYYVLEGGTLSYTDRSGNEGKVDLTGVSAASLIGDGVIIDAATGDYLWDDSANRLYQYSLNSESVRCVYNNQVVLKPDGESPYDYYLVTLDEWAVKQ